MNFRRLALPLLAALAIGLGGVVAQNINKSVQLSQDGSGPIGFDTTNNIYLPGHLLYGSAAPVPTIPSAPPNCGVTQTVNGVSTTPSITGTDFAGEIITGGGTTNCQVNFGRAFLSNPSCLLSSNVVTAPAIVGGQTSTLSASSPIGWTASTAGFVVKMSSAAALRINFFCSGAT